MLDRKFSLDYNFSGFMLGDEAVERGARFDNRRDIERLLGASYGFVKFALARLVDGSRQFWGRRGGGLP